MNSDEQSLYSPHSATGSPSFAQLKLVSDEDLLELLKRGCADAMTVLFHRYHRLILSIALKILRNPGEAEDVMQDVFFEVFRRIERFDPAKGKVKHWLIQLGYSRALNRRQHLFLRDAATAPDMSSKRNGVAEPYFKPDFLQNLKIEERTRMLRKAMEQLAPKHRQTIELTYFKGLLIKEIAKEMGETEVNTRNHYYRGLKKIREILEEL